MADQATNKQRIRDLLAAVDAGDLEAALAFYSSACQGEAPTT
jgi:hypothetical protein